MNKFFISSIFMSGFVNEAIKRELKKIDPGVRPEDEEIIALIKNDIVKRELIDSPDAIEAIAKFEKLQKKAQKEKDGIAKAKEKAILPKVEEPKKE